MMRTPETTIATATISAVIESNCWMPVIFTSASPTSTPSDV